MPDNSSMACKLIEDEKYEIFFIQRATGSHEIAYRSSALPSEPIAELYPPRLRYSPHH